MLKRWGRHLLQLYLIALSIGWSVHWVLSSSSNPPTGFTGSPGDGSNNCTACHSGSSAVSDSGNLALSGLPASWAPGTAYPLTLTLDTGSRRGFLITAESGGTKRGSWADDPSTNNDDVLSTNWVGHRSAGAGGSWNFTWTAPSAGAGTITFYIAGNAANNNSSTSGDVIHLKSIAVAEAALPTLSALSPDFGSIGQSVTLTGSNFSGAASTVTFNTAKASDCTGNSGTLTCSVPAGAGTGDGSISVTVTASGTSGALPFNLLFNPPAPGAASPSFGASTDTARSFTLTGTRFSRSPTVVKLTRSGQSDISATSVVVASSVSLTGSLNLTGAATGLWNLVVTNPDAQSGTLSNGFQIQSLPAAPGAPEGFATSTGSIRWEWADNSSNEDGFRVMTATGGQITQLAAGTTVYEEGGFQLGNKLYTRFVRAFNVVGVADSPTGSSYTFTAVPTAPAAPSVGVSSAGFTWTGPNAAGTTYYAELGADAGFTTPSSSATLSVSAAFAGLATNTTYFFRVLAVGHGGSSTAFTSVISTPTLAAAPAATALVSVNQTGLEFGWSDGGNPAPTRYLAQVSSTAFATLQTSSTLNTGAQFTGLLPNTTYSFRVRAENHAGITTAFDAAGATVTYANTPGTPVALVRGTDTLTIGWAASSNPEGTLFTVEMSTADFAAVAASSATRNTQAVFAGLTFSTSYYFRVRATDHAGRLTADSASGLGRTVADNVAAPAGLAATALGVSSISWSWNASAGAVTYTLYPASDTQSGAAFAAGVTSPIVREFLSPNTPYGARVAGVNGDNEEGLLSAAVTAYTLAVKPSGTAAVAQSSTSIQVQWSPGAVSAYALERSTVSGSDFAQIVSSPTLGEAFIYLDSGLTPATTYFYRVRAFNGDGIPTAYDTQAFTRTFVPDVAAPTGLAGVLLGVSSIAWTWNAVTQAASYSLVQATSPATAYAAGITGTSYSLIGLSPNTAYGARLAALNGDAVAGPLSASATVYTAAQAPAGTGVVVLSSASLRVQWTAGAVSAYAVERSLVSGGSFAQIVSSATQGASNQFTDTGLAQATTYYYRVRAFNAASVPTDYDAQSSGLTAPAPPGTPVLSGLASSTDSIRWSWTYSGAAISTFTLLTSTAGVIATLNAAATFYQELGLEAGFSYTRILRAANATATADSDPLSVATPADSVSVTPSAATTLTALDGETVLLIPSGAAPAAGQAMVSLNPRSAPLLPGSPALIAAANSAIPAGLVGPASAVREFIFLVGTTRFTGDFSTPLTLTIPYPDTDGDGFVDGVTPPLRVENLQVYTLNESTQRWELLAGSSVNKSNRTVSAPSRHLSLFTLLGSPAAADLSGVKVYPNPWKPGSGGSYDAAGVLFKKLTPTASIKIFTVAGEHVRTLDKTAADGDQKLWDGRNAGGAKVASGVYLYLITSPQGKVTGRVAVVR